MKWVTEEKNLKVVQLFRILFLSWLLFHTLLILPNHLEILSLDAFVLQKGFRGDVIWNWILNFINHPLLREHYIYFVAAQIGLILLGIMGIKLRIVIPLITVITLNLNNISGVLMDGGNNLSQLLLIYLMFVNTSGKKQNFPENSFRGYLATGLHNSAYLMCQIQVCLVYLCAGFYKLNGGLWKNGMALYYILQGENYTHPLLKELVMEFPMISLLGTYAAVGLQLAFPVFAFHKKAKIPLFIFASGMHLGIAFGMGLMTFGFMMVISYVLFYDEKFVRKLFPLDEKMKVAWDSQCKICRIYKKMMTTFGTNVAWECARDPKSKILQEISFEDRMEVMHGISNGNVFKGFRCIKEINRRSPFRIFTPLMTLLEKMGLGEKIYRVFSESSFRRNCRGGQCGLIS